MGPPKWFRMVAGLLPDRKDTWQVGYFLSGPWLTALCHLRFSNSPASLACCKAAVIAEICGGPSAFFVATL